MKKLWEDIGNNVEFLLVSALVIAVLFGLAVLGEWWVKKRSGQGHKQVSPVKRMVICAMMGAIAGILMVFEFPIPFLAPSFYQLDFSELPALIAAFAMGPVAGVAVEVVKVLLKLLIKGTSTAFVGDLANLVIGCSMVIPASLIYQFRRTRKTAVVSLTVGTAVMTVFGSMFNAVYLLPTFAVMFQWPLDQIIEMGAAVKPGIHSLTTFVMLAVAPVNLLKGTAVSVLTLLIYKKISVVLRLSR